LGALTTNYLHITPELITGTNDQPAETILKFKISQFGNALLEHILSEMGMTSPVMYKILEKTFQSTDKSNI
jgi:hypothetical protein